MMNPANALAESSLPFRASDRRFAGMKPLLFAGCVGSFACSLLAVGPPLLSISNAPSGTNGAVEFIISWPEADADWLLEESPGLKSPVPWTVVPFTSYVSNGQSNLVTVSAQGSRFYRLHKLGPVAAGLTGWWKLDEETGANESSSGAEISFANTEWAAGRFGVGALRFNGAPGTQAWVSNSSYSVLPAAGAAFSASLWFNPDALPSGSQGLMGNDTSGTNGWRVVLQNLGLGTNQFVFSSSGWPGSLSITGRSLLLPGQWRQLTVSHDGSNGLIFLDGEGIARGTGAVVSHDGPVYFGGGLGGHGGWLGRIDEVRTYTNALSPEQVSLTGHWKFNEAAGGLGVDTSIQGHHAGVTDPAARAPGREGGAVDLDCGHVVIRNEEFAVLPASGGAFSISCWVRPNSPASGRQGLMSCGVSNGWEAVVVGGQPGSPLLHFTSTNHGGTLDLRAPLPLTNGVWMKLDLTFNGGIATAYANGRLIGSVSGAIQGSRSALVVGAAPGATNFPGLIDELKIYNRERGAAEIGPVAETMWETVFAGGTTNLPLRGFGPSGRPLTFNIVPAITPTNGTVPGVSGGSAIYVAGIQKGPDAFAYTVSDGEFTSVPAVVSVSVVQPHWLSPAGGSGEPLDGSSPERAWPAGSADAVDALWRTNAWYDCFFYAPGVYETRGWKYYERSTANPGCKHIGAGIDQTTLRLVDIWSTWSEDVIFGALHNRATCDGFEVHNMHLDCNGTNLPKMVRGEPVWIRIPVMSTGRVETVTIHWQDRYFFGGGYWRIGPAAEFSLCTRRLSANTYVTNCVSVTNGGSVSVVTVGAEADEIILQLERRVSGVDYYGIKEVEIAGTAVSLPVATTSGGSESRLDVQHGIERVADGSGSSWASGPESQVEIILPLAPGTQVSQLNLQWNCEVLGGRRLGAATEYLVRARDETTGLIYNPPYVRHGRAPGGQEIVTFGSLQSTNVLTTDQLVIQLTAREAGVNYFSLREVTLQNGTAPVLMRLPTAVHALDWGDFVVLRAFDRAPATEWASFAQGMAGAAAVTGSNMKFTRLKITGFATTAGRECFVLGWLVQGNYNGGIHQGNVLVEDCMLAEPALFNKDGFTGFSFQDSAPSTLTNAIIRRCTVLGVRSRFIYSQAFSCNFVENCVVDDCGRGFYFEPLAGQNFGATTIRSNRFLNVSQGIYVESHPGAQIDSIMCLGNEIALIGGVGFYGLASCDTCKPGPSGSITNVTALNNVIRYPDWQPRPAAIEGGFAYGDIRHAVYGNNVIALGTVNALRVRPCPVGAIYPPGPVADCDHPVVDPPPPAYPVECVNPLLPGYRRAWFNNRTLAGQTLDVRFNNNGVDGLALQQQWPE